MNNRILKLWLRNMAIAFGSLFGLFAFGFLIVFLNDYFGTQLFSLGIAASVIVAFPALMCYKIAQEQYEREQIRSKRLMDTLKQEHI